MHRGHIHAGLGIFDGEYLPIQRRTVFLTGPQIQRGKLNVFFYAALLIGLQIYLPSNITAFCPDQAAGLAATLRKFLHDDLGRFPLCATGYQADQQLFFQRLRQRAGVIPDSRGIVLS